MHQFSDSGCSGIACKFHRAFGLCGVAMALAMAGLMFSSQAFSTEVSVPESDPLSGVNYFDRPATTILAGSVGMISVSFI